MTPATVLVVDDAAQIRDFVAEYVLRPNGFTVFQADSGEQGLEIARRETLDLVVSDIKMPGLSGIGLAQTLHREQPHLPVILITAEGSEQLAQEALRAHVVDYFIKPFDPEELLASIRRALEARRRPLAVAEQVLATLADPVVVVDAAEQVTLINAAARELFGLAAAPAGVGRLWREVIGPAEAQALLGGDQPTGELLWDDERFFSAVVNRLADGGRVLILHDITALRRAERAKTSFVATIAHDLRSPLTAVLGHVGLIDRFGPVTDAQNTHIRHIRSSVLAMSALLHDLMDLGSMEAGLDSRREAVDPVPLIKKVVDGLRYQAEARQQTLLDHLAGDLPRVLINPVRFRRLITNLVENALKYTPESGRVEVEAYAQEDCLVLRVTDTGIGIAPEDQPRVFEEFFRADHVRQTHLGTGLGLSIVKRIVDDYGGRIWVESRLAEGSRFTVMLPRHMPAERAP